jgi:hypothetical protein
VDFATAKSEFMYNNFMSKFFLLLLLAFCASGCAMNEVYNPVQSATSQTVSLNEAALKSVRLGMKQDEVHRIFGQELIIGYDYEAPALKTTTYKPITVANPYKTVPIKTTRGDCTVEYYVTAIHQPDGVVSNNELMPILFCNGIVTAQGWPDLNRLTPTPN